MNRNCYYTYRILILIHRGLHTIILCALRLWCDCSTPEVRRIVVSTAAAAPTDTVRTHNMCGWCVRRGRGRNNSFKANSTLTTTINNIIYIYIPHEATANTFHYFSFNPHTRGTRAGEISFPRLRSTGRCAVVDWDFIRRSDCMRVPPAARGIGENPAPRVRESNRVVAYGRAACALIGRKRKCVCAMIVCVCAYL
ncbi:hypothetical protein QTP88_005149 [Uroleucon formosanum]